MSIAVVLPVDCTKDIARSAKYRPRYLSHFSWTRL